MNKLLENKVAVITGGSRGIGRVIAELFVSEGASVITLSREKVINDNSNIEHILLDVTNSEETEVIFNEIIKRYGDIDVLVNNAGITADSLTHKMSAKQWDDVIDTNLTGVFNLTKHVGPKMANQGKGSIINVSSVVALYGNIGQANYAASKGALISLGKTWAKEFAMKGANVRVNTIAPGYTLTDMLKTVPDELLKQFAEKTMLNRLADPIEIANVALFLASDLSSYVTGQVISVDGGMRL